MEREITLNGVSAGTITWDPAIGLFNFTLQGCPDIYPLFCSIRLTGQMEILATLPGPDGITLYSQSMPVTNPKFLDQLSWEIGRLGYDL
jgi:hypothetical protein